MAKRTKKIDVFCLLEPIMGPNTRMQERYNTVLFPNWVYWPALEYELEYIGLISDIGYCCGWLTNIIRDLNDYFNKRIRTKRMVLFIEHIIKIKDRAAFELVLDNPILAWESFFVDE